MNKRVSKFLRKVGLVLWQQMGAPERPTARTLYRRLKRDYTQRRGKLRARMPSL